MSATNLYDFETAIEAAVKATLSSITVATPADGKKFQAVRPRVDVTFIPGPAKRSQHVMTDGSRRNATWTGTLYLECITIDDATHRTYRATVRNAMEGALAALNAALDYHRIQGIWDAGTSTDISYEDGYRVSKLTYSVDFGIDSGAWVELTA